MDFKQRLLDGLTTEFPTHTFALGNYKFGPFDFSPKFPIIIDGKESDILFKLELADDLYITLESHRLGISLPHPDALMIPLIPERMEPVVDELVAMYSNMVREHFNITARVW